MAATGFGTVTIDLGRRLLDRGHDVRFISQNEVGILPEPFASRTLDVSTYEYAAMDNDADHKGGIVGMSDVIPTLFSDDPSGLSLASGEKWGNWKAEAVILLGDFYGVKVMTHRLLDYFAIVPTFHYVPIEGHGLPPKWNEIWRVIQPVAMSKFGQEQIGIVTGKVPPLAYHGVDSEAFRPLTPEAPLILGDGPSKVVLGSRERCKMFYFANPRAKVIFRADRNMPRKNYAALIRAMVPVLESHEDAVLAIHCRVWDQGGDLMDLTSKLPAELRERVMMPNLGAIPRGALVGLYNAADVYVSSSAEGFGLTIAEALACGVPAVGIDYSAVPEVIGPGGRAVPVASIVDNEYAHFWAKPDERALGDAVAYFLDHPARAREAGVAGMRHVRQSFTWDAAADVFAQLIEDATAKVAA